MVRLFYMPDAIPVLYPGIMGEIRYRIASHEDDALKLIPPLASHVSCSMEAWRFSFEG